MPSRTSLPSTVIFRGMPTSSSEPGCRRRRRPLLCADWLADCPLQSRPMPLEDLLRFVELGLGTILGKKFTISRLMIS
jgi:hypothetical protein